MKIVKVKPFPQWMSNASSVCFFAEDNVCDPAYELFVMDLGGMFFYEVL